MDRICRRPQLVSVENNRVPCSTLAWACVKPREERPSCSRKRGAWHPVYCIINRNQLGRLRLLLGTWLLLWATPTWAHEILVFARVEGTTIRGTAHYPADVPARDLTVTVSDAAGKSLGQTKTDDKGTFTFKARFRCDHHILVASGDGHGTKYKLPAAMFPKSLPSRDGGSAAESSTDLQALQAEISELRKQLGKHDRRMRLNDLVGGVGCILGICGVAFYFLGVRRKEKRA